ncbi:ORF_16 [Adoxophyes orana granulovirus]|uniref:ORF_16 n=1 Tax=Adoxophyes orana granulovirus TaxID=170617 RepID=Q7T9Z9_GVAO|nr:ORF_16 [Adoxophyes orana granulovirus]AAP85653.1 ORF_16 [Adoxophyes orana granulovirus]AJA91656.1 polyhedral envelope protein 1 [Adoxophyes orana granulovirus]
MTCIPTDSKAFIKPFEGADVTCLIVDVTAWFGADEIISILKQKGPFVLNSLPCSQKAAWKQIEPNVMSDKLFITSLGVRMLIDKSQQHNVYGNSLNNNCFYNNVLIDNNGLEKCSINNRFTNYSNNVLLDNNGLEKCSINNRFPNCSQQTLCPSLHNLGNVFINEAIYDSRAYPQLELINQLINQIYNVVVLKQTIPTPTTPV